MDQNKLKEIRRAMNGRMALIAAGLLLVMNAVTSSARNGLNWIALGNMVTEYQAEHPEGVTKETETEEETAEGKTKETETTEETAEDKTDETEAAEKTAEDKTEESEAAEGSGGEEKAAAEASDGSGTTEEQQLDMEKLISNMDELGLTVGDLKMLGIALLVLAVLKIFVGVICVKFSNRVDKAETTFKAVLVLIGGQLIVLVVMLMKSALDIGMIFNSVIVTCVLLWGAVRMRKLHQENPERIFAVNTNQAAAASRKAKAPAPKKSIREKALMQADEELPAAASGPETAGEGPMEAASEAGLSEHVAEAPENPGAENE